MRRILLTLSCFWLLAAAGCCNEIFCFGGRNVARGVVPVDFEPISPSVSINDRGEILLAWNDDKSVHSRTYQPDTGWTATDTIYTSEEITEEVGTGLVGIRRVVAFETDNGVYRTEGDIGSNWFEVGAMDQSLELDSNLKLASNVYGASAVFAVWRKRLGDAFGPYGGVFSARHLPGASWQDNRRIDTNQQQRGSNPQNALNPVVAVDGRNLAWAAWSQTETANAEFVPGIVVARFNGATWDDAALFAFGASSAGAPALAFDRAGNGVVVWAQDLGVYAATYDVDTDTWTEPVRISPTSSPIAFRPTIAMNGDGDAVVVWTADNTSLFAARYERGNWRPGMRVGSGREPEVGMDAEGNARAVWHHNDRAWASFLPRQSNTWQEPVDLGATNGPPDLAMNEGGVAVAAWHDGEIQTRIWNATTRTLTMEFAGDGAGGYYSPVTAELVCTEPCTITVPDGAVIEFAAAPSAGSVFAGWERCDGEEIGSTCRITMDSDKTIRARFDRAQIPMNATLTIRFAGGGTGTVLVFGGELTCTEECSFQFRTGVPIDLTAVPGTGSVFSRWEGCGDTPGQNPCTVTLTGDTVVTAHFE